MKSVLISALALAVLAGVPSAAFAEESNSSNARNTAITSEVRTCVAAAVATRESALGSAWTTHANAVSSAYTARASALAAAWSGDKNRAQIKSEVRTAWKAFKDAVKKAKGDLRKARKEAWATFKTNAKNCKAPADTLDSGNAGGEA